jgi:hypothetical protein
MLSATARIALSGSLTVALSSCAFSPFPANREEREEQLVKLATTEVIHRGLPLPQKYTTAVASSEEILEFQPAICIYVVDFYAERRHKSMPLYEVVFECQTGKLRDFHDRREEVTSEEIAAAKQAMIQRVGGAPANFSVGAAVTRGEVEAWVSDLRDRGLRQQAHCFIERKTLKVKRFEFVR